MTNSTDLTYLSEVPLPHADPDQVLADASLSVADKRAILADWISDLRAVPDQPALRKLDTGETVPVLDVLSALKRLTGLESQPRRSPAALRNRAKLMRDAIRLRGRRDDDDDDPPPVPAISGHPKPPRSDGDSVRVTGELAVAA